MVVSKDITITTNNYTGTQTAFQPLAWSEAITSAGPGEIVYWVESREAALTLDPWFVPVDHAIVGIVDEIKNDPPEKGAKIPSATSISPFS